MNLNEAVELLDKYLVLPPPPKGMKYYDSKYMPLFVAWKVVKKVIVGHELSALDEKEITPDKIRDLRKQKVLSRRELATLAGFSENYISVIERGFQKPSRHALTHIVKVLESDIPQNKLDAIRQYYREKNRAYYERNRDAFRERSKRQYMKGARKEV